MSISNVSATYEVCLISSLLQICSGREEAAGVVNAMEDPNALDQFVQRDGKQFLLVGQPLYINGWNSYWLMANSVDESTRPRVDAMLHAGASLGLTVCRTWAFNDDGYQALQTSPGTYDESVFQALDYVIAQAKLNGVRLLLSLVNNWNNYGGKAKYVSWGQLGGEDVSCDDDFYTSFKCREYYKAHVKAILTRVNSLTHLEYRDDPTIFGWELINEPQCCRDCSGDTLQAWIEEMASYVKSLDSNHLLTVGTEGYYTTKSDGRCEVNPSDYAGTIGTDFIRNHQAAGIDFSTVHAYPDHWISSQKVEDKLEFLDKWVSGHIQDAAETLNMPVLFTEFGLSDQKPGFDISKRDAFYKIVYDHIFQSARQQGAGAGALLWQFLHPEIADWKDEFGIFPTERSSTIDLIRMQSSRLKMCFDSTCLPDQEERKKLPHEHTITKILKGLHIVK